MELSKRLQMNADLVPEHSAVCDIGCDHGYVSIYLAERKKCSRIIAMDVNPGPLQIAKNNIEQAGLSEEIDCRLSDGMEKLLPGEADTLLIAGMGGMLISRILKEHKQVLQKIHTLILQPQSDLSEVRKTIHLLGFWVEEERICLDGGKYYFALRAKRGEEITAYTETEYEYGRILAEKGDSLYGKYLLFQKEKNERIREKLIQTGTETAKERVRELTHILNGIKKAQKCFERSTNGNRKDNNNSGTGIGYLSKGDDLV
ncbi:MAG: SAM-dependent methyltransferase [Lachnospiraceae bacterium]|nr:SAM-dependent methyltransferase [Lachnospiraceae bacterium]